MGRPGYEAKALIMTLCGTQLCVGVTEIKLLMCSVYHYFLINTVLFYCNTYVKRCQFSRFAVGSGNACP